MTSFKIINISNLDGEILGLPEGPTFDLEGAGQGTCLVWYLRYNGEISGVEVGSNANDLEGCYDLSNPITVVRTGAEAGTIATSEGDTSLMICAGDGVSDAFTVEVSGELQGEIQDWVITDTDGNILGLPEGPTFDLDGAGTGTCLVWHLSYTGDIQGLEVGGNATMLTGACYDLSNPITVTRMGVHAGDIMTTDSMTELTICAGDGIADPFDVVVADDSEGESSGWVITDQEGNILGLPTGPPFDLEGAGQGTCLVWYIRYNGEITGLAEQGNANDLTGCFDLSNPITVVRTGADAGTIATTEGGTELMICAGDGVSDAFTAEVSGDILGEIQDWVITDPDGIILGLPEGPTFDLDGAGTGTCLVWHLSYTGDIQGLEIGGDATMLTGACYDLSNPITITRMGVHAGDIMTTDSLTELTICAGDGVADPFEVMVADDSEGENSGWVITDLEGEILGLPDGPIFDLEGAGQGTCLVWYLRYNGELSGVEVGANADDLAGCFDLSNPITVVRTGAEAGTIATTEGDTSLMICAGDGVSDAFTAEVSGDVQGEMQDWVITDPDGNILGLPEGPTFDLDGAGTGTCLVWHLSYTGDIQGLEVGGNATMLTGACYDLSNPITVTRMGVHAGDIMTSDSLTELTICAGDGVADPFDVVVADDSEGESSGWVITNLEGEILGLPEGPTFDLEGAGEGTCLVWYLRYNGELAGVEVGANANDLDGCFDLSNPITVVRTGAEAGTIATTGGDTELMICAGDGVSDAFTAEVSGDVQGAVQDWVITDPDGNILGLPEGPTFDLEGAGTGTCLVWHLSYSGDIQGLEVGGNATMLTGACYDLSNPITVTRMGVHAGDIMTSDGLTELAICAGDGESDAFDVVVADGSEGENSDWVITNLEGEILGLPEGPTFDLEGAGEGTCLVWYLRYNGEISGVEVGANANDLVGCYDLSNPITVIRTGANAGTIATTDGATELTICAGDGTSDAFTVEISGDIAGETQDWVITDSDGNILGLPEGPTFDLEGAGEGTCLVWYLSYSGDIEGLEVGGNATMLTGACYDLSNPITVTRMGVHAGDITLTNGETELIICAGDGESDAFDVLVEEDSEGENAGWVITDVAGNILGLPMAPPFDLEGAGQGTCLLWYLRYNGELSGAEIGANANDLEGCFDLSNPITVIRRTGLGCNGTLIIEQGITSVGGTWKTINLDKGFSRPIVVATAHLMNKKQKPVVTRVRNAQGNQFELKVQNPGGIVEEDYTVSYMVVEEGVYTEELHGITMEARKVKSNETSFRYRWKTEARKYENRYKNPVVLGQVMTYNDEQWSVFWASRKGIRTLQPSSFSFAAGKHAGEEWKPQREEETLGMIIVESGVHQIEDGLLQAQVGGSIVQGVNSNAAGSRYGTRIEELDNAVASSAGMRSRDGGWPVFMGEEPINGSELRLAIDEDQIKDRERFHIGERVAYIAFGSGKKPKTQYAVDSPVNVTALDINNKISQLTLFPNPSDQQITVDLTLKDRTEALIQVMDGMGRIVSSRQQNYFTGANRAKFDVSQLSPGIYNLQIVIPNQAIMTKQFIIQR